MKIINYNGQIEKERVVDESYEICRSANFPVEYDDVYCHLFGNENLILKLLLDENDKIRGFGVFEEYEIELRNELTRMLYLSGMVIDKKYQGRNISQEIIRRACSEVYLDIISLRTQNIKMAKSLLSLYKETLVRFPLEKDLEMLEILRKTPPFKNMTPKGIIKECYDTRLYPNLTAIKDEFGITLGENDALAVAIKPRPKTYIK